jgi:hypothetical protein
MQVPDVGSAGMAHGPSTARADWPAFWHEPLTELENTVALHGFGEVGDLADPDQLVAAGWWISADGVTMVPPGNTPPEGVEGYRPEGWPR